MEGPAPNPVKEKPKDGYEQVTHMESFPKGRQDVGLAVETAGAYSRLDKMLTPVLRARALPVGVEYWEPGTQRRTRSRPTAVMRRGDNDVPTHLHGLSRTL